MKRRIGGLALHIYWVSLAQLLAIVIAVAVVGWLTINPRRGPEFGAHARYVLDNVVSHGVAPADLRRELTGLHARLHVAITLYDSSRRVIASGVEPPLPAQVQVPFHVPYFGRQHHDLRFSLAAPFAPGSYAVYRPAPPPPHEPVLVILGIALVSTAIASLLLARSFVAPLLQLSAAARRFGAGDLAARARLTRRDEFGQLSEAFDDMAERTVLLVRSQQELLANVSHELRTPLARIRVALDLAKLGDADTAREALGEIAEDLVELERLVADVLQTARLDFAADQARPALPRLHRDRFAAHALLDKAAERFRAHHPERQLEVLTEEPLPECLGDSVLLRRMLDNLLDNAQKYSSTESQVVVRARAEGEQLALSVEDHGVGIAPADLAHVTTPFFRADRSRTRRTGGLGLGLSLARRIVEAHAGTLTIESELGLGTKVRVVIPTELAVSDRLGVGS
jgi:two-component system OmpR family sensor kinase